MCSRYPTDPYRQAWRVRRRDHSEVTYAHRGCGHHDWSHDTAEGLIGLRTPRCEPFVHRDPRSLSSWSPARGPTLASASLAHAALRAGPSSLTAKQLAEECRAAGPTLAARSRGQARWHAVRADLSCSVSGKPPMPRQARLLTSCLASSSVTEVPPEIQ